MDSVRGWRWQRRVCELEHGLIKIIHSKEHREKRLLKGKMKRQRCVGQSQKFYCLHHWNLEGKKKETRAQYLKKQRHPKFGERQIYRNKKFHILQKG